MGIFIFEFCVDMVVYGFWIVVLCLVFFVFRVYVWGDGSLGECCNEEYFEVCEIVFKVCVIIFVCFIWFVLFLVWELVDMCWFFFCM